MNIRLLIVFLGFSFLCAFKPMGNNLNFVKNKQDTTYRIFDTTLFPFSDKSYKLKFHIFDTESYDEEVNNSTITFEHILGNQVKVIFIDSFYCKNSLIDFQDLNNDRIKDILFFYSTGARANPTYHLYLVNPINHKLIYVKGFEDLPNPSLDSQNNIITSIGLSGTNYYKFYRITSKNKLINLGHSFEESDLGDSYKYEKAIRLILKERGK